LLGAAADRADVTYQDEFKRNWFLLLTAVVGAASMPTLAFTTGVFTASWQQEFGWTRGEIGAAMSFANGALIVVPPLVGRLIDRFGVRRPTLLAMAMLPLGFVGLSLVTPQIWTLYATYFLFGAIGSGTSLIPFTRAVGEYFDKGRGLALGITCNSTTLTAYVTPMLANFLIGEFGWRMAWRGFAIVVACLWPVIFFGLKEVKTAKEVKAAAGAPGSAGQHQLGGLQKGYREIARDP
jgi:MFS family permease